MSSTSCVHRTSLVVGFAVYVTILWLQCIYWWDVHI